MKKQIYLISFNSKINCFVYDLFKKLGFCFRLPENSNLRKSEKRKGCRNLNKIFKK